MTSLAALAAAALLAGLSGRPAEPLPGGTGDVLVEAGSARWDGLAGTYHLEGGVVLRRGTVVLRARSADFDPATNEVHAAGGVLLTDATRAVSAEGIRAVLDGPFEADGVVAFLKDGPVALAGATTIEDARRIGRNRLSLSGKRLQGEPSGRLRLGSARLTLCDCGDKLPSWELRAREADVVPGQRAILSWPVLWVTPFFVNRQVPVLAVPWLYLPLGERQTGLLPPILGGTRATRFSIAQPLYVTLGRSTDLTVSPEYALGHARGENDVNPAARGPGARLELRWAPAVGAAGEVELHGIHDLDTEPGGGSGDRLSIVGTHAQRLGDATRLRLDLALASDPVWFRDFTGEALARSAFYARSDALLSHRRDALVLEASAAYLEPLTPVTWGGIAGAPREFGVLGRDVSVFHRWPSAAATLLPTDLGPLALSGRLGVSRYAPARDVDASAALGPGDPGLARWLATTPLLPVVPRLAANRADARLEASAPLRLGPATLEPFLRGAAVGYAFDADPGLDPTFSAWAIGGATLSTELARRYGGTTHSISPRLEVRAGTDALRWGGSERAFPFPAFDAWDRVRTTRSGLLAAASPDPAASVVEIPLLRTLSAAPDGSFRQLRASIENRLEAGAAGRLRLELGQDYDLARGRFAETFAVGTAARGRFSAEVTARALAIDRRPYPVPEPKHRSPLDQLTELRAGVAFGGPRESGVHASLVAVGPGASGVLMAGVDPLFDLRPATVEPTALASGGARAVLGGATIAYDTLVFARAGDAPRCSGEGTRTAGAGHVYQHTAALAWESPCHCFGVRALVRLDGCGNIVSSGVALDLSQLGERAKVQ